MIQYSPLRRIVAPKLVQVDVYDEPRPGGEVVSTGSATYGYMTLETTVYSGGAQDKRIVADTVEAEFVSLTPGTASVDADGLVTILADSAAHQIEVRTPRNGSRRVTFAGYLGLALPVFTDVSFTAGTLAHHMQAQIAALTNSLTPSAQTYGVWESYNGQHPATGTRNPQLFSSPVLDLSGVSIGASDRTNDGRPCTLISPRHAIQAAHWTAPVGTQVTFKRTDGTYQTVTITARRRYDDSVNFTDLSIVMFDEDVTGCSIYSVMPSDWRDRYMPRLTGAPVCGVVPYLRKSRHAPDGSTLSTVITSYDSLHTDIYSNNPFVFTMPNLLSGAGGWSGYAIGGDSSSPSFWIVNGEPILFSAQSTKSYTNDLSTGQSGNGVEIINSAMNDMAGTVGMYALQHPDLSGFTDFTV